MNDFRRVRVLTDISKLSSVLNEPVTREGNVFRRTNSHKGRKVFITPANSTMKHLCYARIILDKSTPKVQFENGKQETALICLSGEVEVSVGAERFKLGERDSVYIPRASSISLETNTLADIAEFSADVDQNYPLQIVRYADVKDDKALHFTAGGAATTRDLNILIGENDQ